MICRRCHNGGSLSRYGWPYVVQDHPMLGNLYCKRDKFDHGSRCGFSCALENFPMPQIVSSTPRTGADVHLCAFWKQFPIYFIGIPSSRLPIAQLYAWGHSPYVNLQIVLLCKATRARIIWTYVWLLTSMGPAMKPIKTKINVWIAVNSWKTLPDASTWYEFEAERHFWNSYGIRSMFVAP